MEFSVNVLGRPVKVLVDPQRMLQEGTHGSYEYPIGGEATIHLAKPHDGTTLFHEMLHALSEFLELELTEQQVRGLELGVPLMFKENPGLWASLMGPAKDA